VLWSVRFKKRLGLAIQSLGLGLIYILANWPNLCPWWICYGIWL